MINEDIAFLTQIAANMKRIQDGLDRGGERTAAAELGECINQLDTFIAIQTIAPSPSKSEVEVMPPYFVNRPEGSDHWTSRLPTLIMRYPPKEDEANG